MQSLNRLVKRCSDPRAAYVVIAIAIMLALPALVSPFFGDDYLHALKWRDAVVRHDGLKILGNYFVFYDGSADAAERMKEQTGAWWVAADLRLAFLRPLSAATHVADHLLWSGNSLLMHVHTLLWWLGVLLVLRALYRRFLAPQVAALALALYAWDDARGMVLSWIANRSALVAAFFGLCAIVTHDRWRRDGWRVGAYLAPLSYALSLLSAEMGISTLGFLLSHALFLDCAKRSNRIACLVPYLFLTCAWQAAYSYFGYGAVASGMYTHPFDEPLVFARALLTNGPVLALGQLTFVTADLWLMYPPVIKAGVVSLALATLLVVARTGWPRLEDKAQARFWLAGAVVALVPASMTVPNDRNLIFVGIGACPLLAMVVKNVLDNPPMLRWPRFVVGFLVVCNLVVAPLLLPVKSTLAFGMKQAFAPMDKGIPRDAATQEKTLVAVGLNAAGVGAMAYSWATREAEHTAKPGRWRMLVVGERDISVTRVDEFTLRLHSRDGFFESVAAQLLHSVSRPFRVGDVVTVSDMTATVTEITGDGRPQTVDFRFETPLESPEWLWTRGRGMGLDAWTPPSIGKTVVIGVGSG